MTCWASTKACRPRHSNSRVAHRPADHGAREEVDDGREVHPPTRVQTAVTSVTQTLFAASAVKSRCSRLSALRSLRSDGLRWSQA